MSGKSIDDVLSTMSLEEAQDLRKKVTKNIKSIRKRKVLSLTVYVQAELRDSFEIAKAWAYEQGLTKKKTNWAFSKFAITNTINIILEQIKKDQEAPPEPPEIVSTKEEPIIA